MKKVLRKVNLGKCILVIILVSSVFVLAGDVVVKEGDLVVGNVDSTGNGTFAGSLTAGTGSFTGNLTVGTSSYQNHLYLQGFSGPEGYCRGGSIAWDWVPTQNTFYTYINYAARFVWDTSPQESDFDTGVAWVDFDNGDAHFEGDLTAKGTILTEGTIQGETFKSTGCTATGTKAVALGDGTTASGGYSTAMGKNTEASGNYSTAMGYGTTAGSNYCIAMGYGTIANRAYCIAMGINTTASGKGGSTAMGRETTASGTYSTSMGYGTTASGTSSTAMGYETTASADYSTAIGEYSINDVANSFTVGYGSGLGSEQVDFRVRSEVVNVYGDLEVDDKVTMGTLVLPTGASDPGSAEQGQIYYRTNDHKVRVYSNGQWKSLAWE